MRSRVPQPPVNKSVSPWAKWNSNSAPTI